MRMPLLERRTGLIGIALALIAGTGGAVLATASSSAEDAVAGLALDGVTAVTVHLGGTPRPAAFAHNSFAYSDPGLGGTAGVDGELIATMGDGTIHALPIHVGSLAIAPDGPP